MSAEPYSLAQLAAEEKELQFPGFTSDDNRSASQLVSRTHPCDSVRPMVDGSGVPCSP